MRRDLRWAVAFLAFAAWHCGNNSAPPCSAAEKQRVEDEFIAETLARCGEAGSPEECPAFPEIDAKYHKRRVDVRRGCQ